VFFLLSKTLDTLLSPLFWSVALIGIGLWGKRPPAGRRWIGIAGVALLTLFSFQPFTNMLERTLERSATRTYREDIAYDSVILLGGIVERAAATDPPAYNENIERLLVTYDLLRTGHARHAIISGGVVDPAVPSLVEASVLAQQLVDWGIASDRIVIEPRSRNTRENALESQRIIEKEGWTRLLIVTSAFHMPRALACFRAIGVAVDTLPVDYRAYDPARFSGSLLPRAGYLDQSTMVLRELFGHAIYKLRGYAR
jgi:uncharacterized SAM-binding protein YcdF (DUF218 family)